MTSPFPPPSGPPIEIEPTVNAVERRHRRAAAVVISVLAVAGLVVGASVFAAGRNDSAPSTAGTQSPPTAVESGAPTNPSTPTSTTPRMPTSVPATTTAPRASPLLNTTVPPITAPYDTDRFFKVSVNSVAYLCEASPSTTHPCERYTSGVTPTMVESRRVLHGLGARLSMHDIRPAGVLRGHLQWHRSHLRSPSQLERASLPTVDWRTAADLDHRCRPVLLRRRPREHVHGVQPRRVLRGRLPRPPTPV